MKIPLHFLLGLAKQCSCAIFFFHLVDVEKNIKVKLKYKIKLLGQTFKQQSRHR